MNGQHHAKNRAFGSASHSSQGAELSPVGDVLEQQTPDAVPDPRGLDPEVFEPADLAARDQRRPANGLAVSLCDVHQPRAQALGRSAVERQ